MVVDPLQPAVILVRPQEQGNVGAAARAMANMGLESLILVEPAVPIGDVALARAVGARDILLCCRRVGDLDSALAPFQWVVGTTSNRARAEYGSPVAPRELPALFARQPAGTATALLFGPESSGLSTSELARCNAVTSIPCSSRQPTLNLSQAVLVLAYELYTASRTREPLPIGEPPANLSEIDGLLDHLQQVLEEVGFARDDTFRSVLQNLRRLAGRGAPTVHETAILRGICRRTLGELERRSK